MKRASRNAVSAVTERSPLTMAPIRVAATRGAMARAFADMPTASETPLQHFPRMGGHTRGDCDPVSGSSTIVRTLLGHATDRILAPLLVGPTAHAMPCQVRISGLTTRSSGNRPKSRSADHNSRTPCCRQRATMRASWTCGPAMRGWAQERAQLGPMRLRLGAAIVKIGDSPHASICSKRACERRRRRVHARMGYDRQEFVRARPGIAHKTAPSASETMRSSAASWKGESAPRP